MGHKKTKEKFQFTLDYQLDLLRFSVQDRNGYKAINLYEDSYYTLTEHAIIAFALKHYLKKNHSVPGLTMLKEELISTYKRRDFVNLLSEEDRTTTLKIAESLYKGEVKDGEEILKKCSKWASYVELKNEIESVDLLDFASHEAFSSRVIKAINKTNEYEDSHGTFLIGDISTRQLQRLSNPSIIPTPFKQLNKLTNAGGYSKGSILVILDKPKSRKTYTLIAIARASLRIKRKVFFIDLENGQDEISIRLEQGMTNKSKREVLSGESDKSTQALFRRYKRLGIEAYVKRFPAGSTTADFQAEVDHVYREHGIQFDDVVIDYVALMNSLSGAVDDFKRISDAYLDVGNFALKNGYGHVWTANHVKRDAEKHQQTRYHDGDIAKCIDIVRHAQAIFGLNSSDEELNQGLLRMELVVQRDGKPFGRAMFHANPEHQTLKELNQQELIVYENGIGSKHDLEPEEQVKKYKGDI